MQLKTKKKKGKIEEEIKKLQKQQLWFLYDEKRKSHAQHKEGRDKFRNVLEQKQKEIEPTRNKLTQKKKAVNDLKKFIRDKIDGVKRKQNMGDQLQVQYEKLEESLQDAHRDYAAKKQEEEQRERELLDFGRQLDVLVGQLQILPEVDDEQAQKTLLELTHKIQNASQNVAKLHNRRQEAVMMKRSAEQKITACERGLKDIQDVGQQRLELLNKRNRDAYNAARWLEKNKDKFSASVYPPMCTLLNMKDPKFAKYVEGRVSGNDLVSFVCENKEDMNLFKELMDKQRIRVNIVHSTTTDLARYKPKIPIENLRRYGFENYMLDCIDAPPAILSYLCRNYDVHNIPIAENGDYAAVPHEIVFFFMGDHRYAKNKSRYDGEWSTTIYPIREAELLHITLDTQRIGQLRHSISESQEQIAEVEQTLVEVKKEEVEIGRNLESWRNDKRVLISRKEERKQLQQRISQKRNQIIRRKEGAIDLKTEEDKMKARLEEVVKAMVAVTCKRGEAVKSSVEEFQEYLKHMSLAKTARADVHAIEELLTSAEQDLASHEEQMGKMLRELELYKTEAQVALQKLLRALGVNNYRQISPEIREKFQNSNLKDTETELANLEAHRDCIITASDKEVQEYTKREAEVRQLQRRVDDAQVAAENHQKELEESRARWIPRITELTENISSSFSQFMARLGCAGEVLLEKGEQEDDFSKYGIVIKVRFRDSERLRELTAQHQSGGERAVSTALYLLALQSLTSVPFRCVDEINQGMDPINERQMLNMLMETAASEGSSQYFFVSPKLIPDMTYNNYVNVMVVFNSQMMLPHRKFNLKRILKKRNELNKRESTWGSVC